MNLGKSCQIQVLAFHQGLFVFQKKDQQGDRHGIWNS